MAPPTKAPSRKAFKEIYILAYRFIQIHVGDITETEVFFATYNTDGSTNYVPVCIFSKTSRRRATESGYGACGRC